jgi:hypothetical protein
MSADDPAAPHPWPYVRKHLLRSVLTTAGIVLGVALLVGIQTANRSVLGAFTTL